ncbi:exocyst complex component Sec6-domain-containing protein [Cladochytrium replicatum]|nr:exocyst complex component Sec6-domain-containing protein [Cladochytrium replicatum]
MSAMITPDLIADAKEAAHLRIADLLRSPDDLTNKLPGIRRKFGKEGASIEAQLKTVVESQLEDAQRGLDVLGMSTSITEQLKGNLSTIDRLCADAQSSISNFSKIEKISKAHQNFKRTKQVIDNFQQLSNNVTRVNQLLEVDSKDPQGSADNLLLIHYQLFQLENFRHETLQKARGFSTDVMNTLNTYFQRVDEIASRFETFLWQLAKNVIPLVKKGNPSTVVRLVKIIEMEERADEMAALQEVGDDSRSRPIKSYRIKFFDVIREGISDQMANMYNEFKGDLPKLMWGMDKAVDDLVLIHDEVVPLFAKRYNIFQFFVLECHRNVYEVVNRTIHGPMDAGAILQLLKWVRDYYSNMSGRLGVGEELLEPRLLDGNEEELIGQYVNLVHDKLSEWLTNLLRTETADFIKRDHAPEIDGNGMYFLTGSIIVFQMFNQQLDIIQNSFRGQLLTDVVKVCTSLIEQFQMTWTEVLDAEHNKFLAKSPELTLGIVEYTCALANDSMRSTEFSDIITARFETLADTPQRQQVLGYITAVRDGFMKLAKHCYTVVIDIMLTDAKPAFSKLHCPEWYEQDLMKLVIGTLEDYCDDLQAHMTEYLFSKLSTDLLDRFLILYIDTMRSKSAKYRMPAAVDRLKSDQALALEFFSKYKSAKRVKASFDVIEKLVAMLESNARIAFLDFYALWKAYPDIPIPMVEDLFGKRDDLDRTTQKELIENVRQKVKEEPLAVTQPSIFSRLPAK